MSSPAVPPPLPNNAGWRLETTLGDGRNESGLKLHLVSLKKERGGSRRPSSVRLENSYARAPLDMLPCIHRAGLFG
jgi:hypothetical protein